MRIAVFASEGAPYIKSGGLGDVMEALPAALSRIPGNEVVLMLPYYQKIKNNPAYEVEQVASFDVTLGWRQLYCGVMKLNNRNDGVQVYFIDNDYYFGGRPGAIYGDLDDGERFAYFSKACLDALDAVGFIPNVIQCNDWQTALIPLLTRSEYGPEFSGAKTVFTIHNVEYQGWADRGFFYDVLELPEWCLERLEKDGALNYMKAAIEMADSVTTVSETYAKELLYPYYAHGMEGVLQENSGKLCGIINGIDVRVFDPTADPSLFARYGAADYSAGKAVNKAKMQALCNLPQRPDVPMMAMITRLAGHKGIDLLCYIIDSLMERDIQLVILGTGEKQYEQALKEAEARYPDKLSVNLCFNTVLASQLYAAADIYLMPSRSEPCGLSQIIAMHYGTIPVVNATGGLKDTVAPYNIQTGEGRGFTFQSYNGEDFRDAIDRCLDLYRYEKEKWDALIRADMALDVSWRVPAGKYMELFRSLVN